MSDDLKNEFHNYFNYFTEVEEHFQRARGSGLFLLSPMDWALIETWKNAGVPIEAVLRGIDAAFEKWRSRKTRTQQVNSIAYCAQAIAKEASQAGSASRPAHQDSPPPFANEEVIAYLTRNATILTRGGFKEIGDKVALLAQNPPADLEELEQRLTALEDKLLAMLRSRLGEEELFNARRDLDLSLKPYRGKMTADQLAMLEKQYFDRRLLEHANLPRLSLFYLH